MSKKIMPIFNVSLETHRKHLYVDGAIEDGINLFKAGNVEGGGIKRDIRASTGAI